MHNLSNISSGSNQSCVLYNTKTIRYNVHNFDCPGVEIWQIIRSYCQIPILLCCS